MLIRLVLFFFLTFHVNILIAQSGSISGFVFDDSKGEFFGNENIYVENFYHFYNTHRNVQNIDGNLHEPLFHIDGDGIGVFGSAVLDTLSLNILKK